MKEARKRNPALRLGALAWGAPGWLGTAAGEHVESCANFTCVEQMHTCNCNAYSNSSGQPVGCVWNETYAKYCPFFTRDTARYLVGWLKGAKTHHGLNFDFIGIPFGMSGSLQPSSQSCCAKSWIRQAFVTSASSPQTTAHAAI
jgi:hypothetical protein